MENMKVPNHIAIILDGNGRWAKAKGMPRGYGHIKGCANLEQICYDIKDLGVKSYGICFFNRKLETLQRRSRRTDETVPQLSQKMYEECGKKSYASEGHWRSDCI